EAALKEFARLAREDKSAVVRLYLASALQRLPPEKRWDIVESLASHSEDSGDHNLPLMVWYAAEPLAALDSRRALALAEKARLPNILNFMVRRVAAVNTPDAFAAVTEALDQTADDTRRVEILKGLAAALKGQRSAPMPKGWPGMETKLKGSSNAEVRAQLEAVSLTFGSASAVADLKKTLM